MTVRLGPFSSLVLVLLVLVQAHELEAQKIKHVVVLMQENRSFDHLLGWLKRENPEINGLTGNECNPMDTTDPTSQSVCVNDHQPYKIFIDPSHSVEGTAEQVYGVWPPPADLPDVPPMNGFVQKYVSQGGIPDEVIGAFAPKDIPITAALANEFAIFDRWFCAVPGPTQPNRMYVHTATSDGMGTNNVLRLALGMPQKSIYQSLTEADLTWTNYFQEVPSVLLLKWPRLPSNWNSFKHYNAFKADCANGTLPHFSFIDPRYLDAPNAPQNDNHPGNADLRRGEHLIKDIYETLRASPAWTDTVFIITYDEHGGFYDHVPPRNVVPSPDGKISRDPPFDFTRHGVRIPTIMISPWINKGTVVHAASGPTPTSEYEASSVPATLKKIFNIEADFLTARDAWAGTFEGVWANRTTPRLDCPVTLPDAPVIDTPQENQDVDDLQKEFIAMAGGLNGLFVSGDGMSEFEASYFIKEQVSKFFGRCMYEGADLYDGEYCHTD